MTYQILYKIFQGEVLYMDIPLSSLQGGENSREYKPSP
jgi:hypothetical protein